MNGEARPSRLLVIVGCLVTAAAVAGLLLGDDATLTGGFLVVGAGLLLVAVLSPRLSGHQKLGLTGLEFNLDRAISAGEKDIKLDNLIPLDELSEAADAAAESHQDPPQG